ncbi:MAG: hypothetical protein A2X20_06190 [Bacteroidetes bacterium GWE2_40_15]|nr:MAG: hypothetical protein A2X20_06190 [Bacteroidetes bacterium GWE2_40_15]
MKKIDQSKNQLLEQLSKTSIVQIACEKTGISRASFYRWKEEDVDFAKKADEAILTGRLLINDLAESQLIHAVKDRNMNAIMYWLRHHHEDYRNRLELETKVNTIFELSPEQKTLVEQALKLADLTLDSYGKSNE